MDWIFDNLKLLVFIAIIVIYVMKAVRAKSETEGDPNGPQPSSRRTLEGEEDPEEAERTRQIQEEIRRRILARQRGEPATPMPTEVMEEPPQPPPIPPPIPAPSPRVEPKDDPYAHADPEREMHEARMLEAQRAMDEQLRQVRLAREMATVAVPSLALPTSPAPSRTTSAAQRGWRAELSGRHALRRAIILREVLGEPVGLRRGPAGMTQR